MKSCEIKSPCSPGDSVYYLGNDGVQLLLVKEIKTYKDHDKDEILTVVCFSDHPYIILTDETEQRLFSNYSEAIIAFKEFNNG